MTSYFSDAGNVSSSWTQDTYTNWLDSCAAALPSGEKVDNIGGVSRLKKIVTGSFMSFREKWSRVLLVPSPSIEHENVFSHFVFWKHLHAKITTTTTMRQKADMAVIIAYCRPFVIMFRCRRRRRRRHLSKSAPIFVRASHV
jgi:hypothetical protein